MFAKGDFIVYGRTGICEVTDISTIKMDGVSSDKLYYILCPCHEKGGRIFTPVDNSKVVMRKVISKDEAAKLVGQIPEIETLWIANEKMREAQYKESMRTCDCTEWIKIIKTLYLRRKQRIAQGKKITATDERYLKQAEGNLYSELSIALGVPEQDMESYITEHIESGKKTV